MIIQAGKECVLALRNWEPDPAWQGTGRYEGSQESLGEKAANNPIRQSVLALRDHFVTVLEDVPDPDEQEKLIAVFYAFIRSQWILLNTQSGYRLADGKIDRDIYYRCGLLSAFLQQLEWFLDPMDVSRMTEFLNQPTRTAQILSGEALTAQPLSENSDIQDLIRDLVRLKQEAEMARTERAILEAELGFSDASAVLDYVHGMRDRLNALEDLQFMLGNLEDTVSLVNI